MEKRFEIQSQALKAITKNQFNGVLDIAPRVGKTKIGIDIINAYRKKYKKPILITVPLNTIMEGWQKDYSKWGEGEIPKIINQRSLHQENLSQYGMIILDEVHTLSENQLEILSSANLSKTIGLSGSISDDTKKILKMKLGINPVYEYSVEQAIEDNIISNFNITCIGVNLDNTNKYLMCGNKGKEQPATELEAYKFYTNKFEYFKRISFGNPKLANVKMKYAGDRANLIYKSKTKFNKALEISKKLLNDQKRHLIFTARTEVADQFGYSFHSKAPQENLDLFKNTEINTLAVCEMVAMGVTFPNLKCGLFHQIRSSEESAIQKVLRMCNLEGDEVADIFIVYYKNTVDEDWVKSALKPFNENKIIWL